VVDQREPPAHVARVGVRVGALVLEEGARARPGVQRPCVPEAGHQHLAGVEHLLDLVDRDVVVVGAVGRCVGGADHADGADRDEDVAVAEACLAEAEVTHLAGRVYTTLSGGERQRVQLARVLAQIGFPGSSDEGRYLLLDEPTASLDPAHQHATLRTARRAAERGVGVVAILHDLNLAALYADRLVVLSRGRLAAEGAPEAVLTETLVREVFDLPVHVTRHPTRGCPQVVAV